MKVGTDSIVLGSWLADVPGKRVLDIGTGSGLLALMLAQHKAPQCEIVGLEIIEAAAQQAMDNVAQSPWADCVTVVTGDIQVYDSAHPFDLIVSNPPYFEPAIAMSNDRHTARYTEQLTHQALLAAVARLLDTGGCFACVLPADLCDSFCHLAAQQGLFLSKRLDIITREGLPPHRVCLQFTQNATYPEVHKLLVYTTNLRYSEGYKALCSAFYKNF